jgi:hypothetical protein
MRSTGALALALTVLAVACGPGRGGLSRPSSERRIDCPVKGSGFQYTARFVPGDARSPNDNLYVTFTPKRPSSAEAAAILETCINTTVKTIRVDYELLATAWFNKEGPLPLPDGAATLNYDPKAGAIKRPSSRPAAPAEPIVRLPEYTVGPLTSQNPTDSSNSAVKLEVIFTREPSEADVIRVLVRAIENNVRAQRNRVNTSAYPRVAVGTTRQPIRGANGVFLAAHYDAKTSEIRDQNRVVVGRIK